MKNLIKTIIRLTGGRLRGVKAGVSNIVETINGMWGIIVCMLVTQDSVYVVDYYGIDYLTSVALCFTVRDIVYGVVNWLYHNKGSVVNSIVGYFKCVDWYEREIWDMYGLVFNGHPNLSRILTDYGTTFFPLRKSFPLVGFKEIRYDGEFNKIYYSKVFLIQDFRYFDFTSCWV
jgi:NADH:ubiquinone oxidoreductase subunit C